jgi:hypothetical protein
VNIAGNKFSPERVYGIVRVIGEAGRIQELEMSKCRFEGRFEEVAEMVRRNK